MSSADALRGVRSTPIVVYHGQDSDGPAEDCVEIDPSHEHAEGLAIRWEPAHREAFDSLRKAEVGFPQILSSCDAVEKWMQDNGKRVRGHPVK